MARLHLNANPSHSLLALAPVQGSLMETQVRAKFLNLESYFFFLHFNCGASKKVHIHAWI